MEEEEGQEAQAQEEEDEGEVQVGARTSLRGDVPCPYVAALMILLIRMIDRPLDPGLKSPPISEVVMSLAAARPLIGVHSDKNAPTGTTVCLPAVFRAPVR